MRAADQIRAARQVAPLRRSIDRSQRGGVDREVYAHRPPARPHEGDRNQHGIPIISVQLRADRGHIAGRKLLDILAVEKQFDGFNRIALKLDQILSRRLAIVPSRSAMR